MDLLKGLTRQEKMDITRKTARYAGWAPRAPDDVKLKAMQAVATIRGGACLALEWTGNFTKARWRCHRGDEWEATIQQVWYYATWCPYCAGVVIRGNPTHEEVKMARRKRVKLTRNTRKFGKLVAECSTLPEFDQVDYGEATRIFNEIRESKMIEGRSHRVFGAIAILLSAQNHGQAISFALMAKTMGITRKALFRLYQMTRERLSAKIGEIRSVPPPSAQVPRLTADLGLPEALCSAAVGLIDRATAEGYDVTGKSPLGIAAAAIYLVYKAQRDVKIKKPQETIAKTAMISTLPLRNRARELKKYLVE